MPLEETKLEFEGWSWTQHYQIVIHADFRAPLTQIFENKDGNAIAFQKHKSVSYGFIVKITVPYYF